MMATFVQWATILSPIIAVGLAWWTSRRGARDTAKLVKSIKKLTQIQLQLSMLKLFKEAKEEHANFEILHERSKYLSNQRWSNYTNWMNDTLLQNEEKERDIDDKKDFSFKRREIIMELLSELDDMRKEVKKM